MRRSRSTVRAVNGVISLGPRHTPSESASKCPANEESGLAGTFITSTLGFYSEREKQRAGLA